MHHIVFPIRIMKNVLFSVSGQNPGPSCSIDCSQPPTFQCDLRDRARVTVNGGHLDFQSYSVSPGEEYKVYLGGGGRFGRGAPTP